MVRDQYLCPRASRPTISSFLAASFLTFSCWIRAGGPRQSLADLFSMALDLKWDHLCAVVVCRMQSV